MAKIGRDELRGQMPRRMPPAPSRETSPPMGRRSVGRSRNAGDYAVCMPASAGAPHESLEELTIATRHRRPSRLRSMRAEIPAPLEARTGPVSRQIRIGIAGEFSEENPALGMNGRCGVAWTLSTICTELGTAVSTRRLLPAAARSRSARRTVARR